MEIQGPSNGSHIRADSAVSRRIGKPHVESEKRVQGQIETRASAVHVKSPEIVALLERLQDYSEVRSGRVSEIAARLANGDYDTRDAARRTATRIVEGP